MREKMSTHTMGLERDGVLQQTYRRNCPSRRRYTWRPRPVALAVGRTMCMAAVLLAMLVPSRAAQVNFQNCLQSNIVGSQNPQLLQWTPEYVTATFDLTNSTHNLNITIYGNVSGQATAGTLPDPDNATYWNNPNNTFGKIVDLDPTYRHWSTLFAKYSVLSYVPYASQPGERFCNATVGVQCPIGPVFNDNVSLTDLPAFTYAHDMQASYGFTTINAELNVVSGDQAATPLACVIADITPYLGAPAENLLTFLPLLVLVLVGVATASAAIFSPWGTWDIFRWTSNNGRDADQLRLITPGFGDCLQYIQFIALSGSLSLNYPGFYQPAVSQVSWSALMFNESFVTHGGGFIAIEDGIYVTNGTYGLDVMSQLVGTTTDQDLWAGMIVWLAILLAAITLITQLGFLVRLIYRVVSKTQEEDLRAKNFPFTIGNVIRVVFNYFLLPIVTLSMYQLVITPGATNLATVAFAAVTLVVLLIFSGWLLWLIISARPRSFLFDDLPTVLLYGPLYNTYSDNAAAFALAPVIVTILRGIAIGAVQPSGIAQIVLLALCEIIWVLALNAFRPFSSPTSMNAYHTIFSVVRLISVLLMIAFVPSLGISDAARGWIGYVILLMHGITLFIGFFLHSLQTIIEVFTRLAGAGGEDGAVGGFARTFGLRQLSRRAPRGARRNRSSMASEATMLNNMQGDKVVPTGGTRSRSVSASSGLLLNTHANRQSVGLDSVSAAGGGHSHNGSAGVPSTAPESSHFGGVSTQGTLANLRSTEPTDPYFRQPRPRRTTMELASPTNARSRASWGSGDWTKINSPEPVETDAGEGPSVSGRGTPLPNIWAGGRERSDSNGEERIKADYSTREVDYYYGVRGPALSHMPTRRLKTGPADPTGPVSSATGWFKNIFGGKTKENGKGFEVVRSSRMPPRMEADEKAVASDRLYTDDAEPSTARAIPERPRHFELDDEGDAVGGGTRHLPEDNRDNGQRSLDDYAPNLPEIDAGSSINIPSRFGSGKSTQPSRANTKRSANEPTPDLPRKSSKRVSVFKEDIDDSQERAARLSVISPSPPDSPRRQASGGGVWPLSQSSESQSKLPSLPFGGLSPNPPTKHQRTPSASSAVSAMSGNSVNSGKSAVSALTSQSHGQNSAHTHDHAARASSALENYPPNFREDDRPSSMGFVQQHRASDNIHRVSAGDPHLHTGSTAELVDESTTIDLSPDS